MIVLCEECKWLGASANGDPYCVFNNVPLSQPGCLVGDVREKNNRDILRSMTDAELAHFMMQTTDCPCIAKEPGCCRSDISCQKAWIDYLKREA